MDIDLGFYRDVYGGHHGSEILPFLKAAADTVEAAVSGGTGRNMGYAACIEADYRYDRQYKSAKLGDFSYTSGESISMGIISPGARMYLEGRGMLCRCVEDVRNR